jgi:hypothetical protein
MMRTMKQTTTAPKPITLTPEIIARCAGPDQAATFDRGVRAFLAVPKKALPPSPFGKRKRENELMAKSPRRPRHSS